MHAQRGTKSHATLKSNGQLSVRMLSRVIPMIEGSLASIAASPRTNKVISRRLIGILVANKEVPAHPAIIFSNE